MINQSGSISVRILILKCPINYHQCKQGALVNVLSFLSFFYFMKYDPPGPRFPCKENGSWMDGQDLAPLVRSWKKLVESLSPHHITSDGAIGPICSPSSTIAPVTTDKAFSQSF